jgi:hypothetical protein
MGQLELFKAQLCLTLHLSKSLVFFVAYNKNMKVLCWKSISGL